MGRREEGEGCGRRGEWRGRGVEGEESGGEGVWKVVDGGGVWKVLDGGGVWRMKSRTHIISARRVPTTHTVPRMSVSVCTLVCTCV